MATSAKMTGIDKFSQAGVYCGATGMAVGGWLTKNHVMIGSIGIIIGAILGICSFTVHAWWTWYQYKNLKERVKNDSQEF